MGLPLCKVSYLLQKLNDSGGYLVFAALLGRLVLTETLWRLPNQYLQHLLISHINFSSLLCSNNTLSCGSHVNLITTKTAASLDALKTLRCHGLDNQALWDVTQATLVAQLLYASTFWCGVINAEETNRLQSILNKTIRRSYLLHDFKSLDELLDSADHALFRVIVRNPHHVLYPLLPPRKRNI